jgi:precorrin-2/cobalt-factor-2 C20-methyltransferase
VKLGTLYGIGIGPGDPELITVKGARILGSCRHVFVPKARSSAESVALGIAERHIHSQAAVHEVLFPMTTDRTELEARWGASAKAIAEILEAGEDACFLTLGDALLYSTYIYLLRALRRRIPDVKVVTVPGITAFSAAAALTDFPVGEAKEPVVIVPTTDDLEDVKRALSMGGTVVLMKIGKRLRQILELMEERGLLERGVFVSHAGMEGERVETDLRRLRGERAEAGYLSIILVRAGRSNQ